MTRSCARPRRARCPRVTPAWPRGRAKPLSKPPPDRSGEQAARLLQLVGEWGAPRQFERSFRMSAGSLQSNRFLLTLNAADIPGDACASALAVCVAMGMPPAQRAAAAAQFAQARAVHFGFEGDAGGCLCKLYLEHAVSRPRPRAWPTPPGSRCCSTSPTNGTRRGAGG